jgi:hypothetical protein
MELGKNDAICLQKKVCSFSFPKKLGEICSEIGNEMLRRRISERRTKDMMSLMRFKL